LADGAGVAWFHHVVFLFPGAHVLGQLLHHGGFALLLQGVFALETRLHLVVSRVVFLVLLEHLGVVT